MISAAVTPVPSDMRGTTSTLKQTTDINMEADFAPPPAPMAMPKQVIERSVAQGASQRLRLPFFGGRMQGQP